MRPNPQIASVLPASSIPVNSRRFHWPDLVKRSAAGILRASARINPIVSSATLVAFASSGAMTTTPRSDTAGISMLSSPTPIRPMPMSFAAASSKGAVTRV
jgi:hypothetical protein